MAPGASHPRAGKGHKMLWSQTRDPSHFPSRGRSRIFLGGGGGREEKEKKGKRAFHPGASSPFRILVPGHGLETPRAAGGPTSCPAFIVACSVSPRLCPPLASKALRSATCLSANGSRAPRPPKRSFQLLFFYKPGLIKRQGQGSSGVAKAESKQRREVGFSPTQGAMQLGTPIKHGVNVGPLPGTHFSQLRYGYECACDP